MNTLIKDAIETAKSQFKPLRELYRESNTKPQTIAVNADQFNALCDVISFANPVFIAISPLGWGKSEDGPFEAVTRCKRAGGKPKKGQIKLYLASGETDVYGDGSWAFPIGCAPVLIETI